MIVISVDQNFITKVENVKHAQLSVTVRNALILVVLSQNVKDVVWATS